MKNYSKLFYVALFGLFFVSCTEQSDDSTPVEPENEEVAACQYSLDPENASVTFTAYKFLNKTGVKGTFEDLKIEGTSSQEDPLKVLDGASFEIPVSSLNTNDEGRDEKINTHFFAGINTETISGKVVALQDGKATVTISMNGISNDVEGEYTFEDDTFTFDATIDVLDWDGEEGINALNEECKDLHIDHANGDTESKLWSEVTIGFSAQFSKDCE